MNIEFEPVESPEYIAWCEKNNFGYCEGVSTDGNWIRQKVFLSDDTTKKDYRYFVFKTYNPFDEEKQAPKPYRVSSEDGTYKTAHQHREDFLNSLQKGIFIPNGQALKKDDPFFGVEYNKPNKY